MSARGKTHLCPGRANMFTPRSDNPGHPVGSRSTGAWSLLPVFAVVDPRANIIGRLFDLCAGIALTAFGVAHMLSTIAAAINPISVLSR
eukprot:14627070-Alexandrium_andersonii.AAC.1